MRRRLSALVAVLAAGLVGCSDTPDTAGPLWPDLVVEDLATGSPVSSRSMLGDSTGRISVVSVWAVWCQPCRREMPALQREFADQTDIVAVVGVNHGDDPVAARDFLTEVGVSFPSMTDRDGRLVAALGVVSLPATFVVNTRGEITWQRLGIIDAAEVAQAVDAARSVSAQSSLSGPIDG